MQRKRTVNPRVRAGRVELDDRPGDVHARIPLVAVAANVPANFEHIWVGVQLRRDLLHLLIGLGMIAKFQPALSGEQMVAVRWRERFHSRVKFL